MKRNNFVCIFGLVLILLGSFVWIKPSFAITPQIEAGGSHTIAGKSDGIRRGVWAGQLGERNKYFKQTEPSPAHFLG